MKRRSFFPTFAIAAVGEVLIGSESKPKLKILLDPDAPANSMAEMGELRFPVGLGRDGVTPAGKSFQQGRSLLGRFRVNAILTRRRFEMEAQLIRQSGKSAKWLRQNLFSNMSAIDFDGDGKGGEYGDAFIGLSPIDSAARQPFHFGFYKGVFRWYSYAIHGTQDESRIGKCISGGCINAGKEDLAKMIAGLKLGDLVEIS